MKKLMLFLALACCLFCANSLVAFEKTAPKLTNGLYLVHAEFNNPENGKMLPAGFRLLEFSTEHFTSRTGQVDPVRYIVIKDVPSVPVVLDEEPELSKTNDKYELALSFTLAPEYVNQMEKFTGDNIGKRVVLVIGGKIITMHGIKAAIKNGQIRITRCTDNGCEFIYRNLLKSGKVENRNK